MHESKDLLELQHKQDALRMTGESIGKERGRGVAQDVMSKSRDVIK